MTKPIFPSVQAPQLTPPSFGNIGPTQPRGLNFGDTGALKGPATSPAGIAGPNAGSQLRHLEGKQPPPAGELAPKSASIETPPEEEVTPAPQAQKPTQEVQTEAPLAIPRPGQSAASVSSTAPSPTPVPAQESAPAAQAAAPQKSWSEAFGDDKVEIPQKATAETAEELAANPSPSSSTNPRDIDTNVVPLAVDSEGVKMAADIEKEQVDERRLANNKPLNLEPMVLRRNPVTGKEVLVPYTPATALVAQINKSATEHTAEQTKLEAQGEAQERAAGESSDTGAADETGETVNVPPAPEGTPGVEGAEGPQAMDGDTSQSPSVDSKNALMFQYQVNADTGALEPVTDQQGYGILKSGDSFSNPQASKEAGDAADAVAILRTGNTQASQAHTLLAQNSNPQELAMMNQQQIMDEVNNGVHARYRNAVNTWKQSAEAYPQDDGVTPYQAYQMGVHGGLINHSVAHAAPKPESKWNEVNPDSWPLKDLTGTEAKHLLQSEFLEPGSNPTGTQLASLVDGYKEAANPKEPEPTPEEKQKAFMKQLEGSIQQSVTENIAGGVGKMFDFGGMYQDASAGLDRMLDGLVEALLKGLVDSTNNMIASMGGGPRGGAV